MIVNRYVLLVLSLLESLIDPLLLSSAPSESLVKGSIPKLLASYSFFSSPSRPSLFCNQIFCKNKTKKGNV